MELELEMEQVLEQALEMELELGGNRARIRMQAPLVRKSRRASSGYYT